MGNYRKYLFAFGAALAWGFGANFAKLGINQGIQPIAGSMLAFTVAIPFLWLIARQAGAATPPKRLDLPTVLWLCGAGASSALASVFYFLALSQGQVAVVLAISNVYPFFAILFSFLLLRRKEKLTRNVLLGAALAVGGGALLVLPPMF